MTTIKPLFIPLRMKYFLKFWMGQKKTEYRPYGKRWNEKTCYPGRAVTLSGGYGKRHRMQGKVVKAEIVEPSADFIEIYGPGVPCYGIEIAVDEPQSPAAI